MEVPWRKIADSPIEGRIGEGFVWTGTEMIVWGGLSRGTLELLTDGASYNSTTNTWRKISLPPSGVMGIANEGSAWTGSKALFWAGNSPDGPAVGAAYTPSTDSWRRLSRGPLGQREGYASVWTGVELILAGGAGGDSFVTRVSAAVNPKANTWRSLTSFDELHGLSAHGAIWTGKEAVLAGNLSLCPEQGSACQESRHVLVAYTPKNNALREIDLKRVPVQVEGHFLKPLAWSAEEAILELAKVGSYGTLRYRPSNNSWAVGQKAPCAVPEHGNVQTAWIGDRYVVPCGQDRIQLYDPATDAWQILTTGPSPLSSRSGSAIVWTGRDLIAWSGALQHPGGPSASDGWAITLAEQ